MTEVIEDGGKDDLVTSERVQVSVLGMLCAGHVVCWACCVLAMLCAGHVVALEMEG